MKKSYFSLPQIAKLIGVSRVTVYQRVRKGLIPAVKVGRNYVVPEVYVRTILGKNLTDDKKTILDQAVHRTVEKFGETLRLLGNE
jgi:excisionase family DNA binding protein